jgi:hypothetical protein
MFDISALSSDVLACFCNFVLSDQNVVNLFVCCKKMKASQFLTKVDLKGIYKQSMCNNYKTLYELRKRIRRWTLFQVTDNLPPYLYELKLANKFNESNITKGIFPVTLKQLTFGYCFNQNIDTITLPVMLQRLTFGYFFDRNIDKVKLPSALQHLTFGTWFNQNIDNVTFPVTLQRLTFGLVFDQNIDNVKLPVVLERLAFGASFNQNMNNVKLPSCLKELIFDRDFNQKH